MSEAKGMVGLRLLLCPLGSNVVIRTACCTVGVALPVYSTFKAIESKDQDAQHKCLLYWAGWLKSSFNIGMEGGCRIIDRVMNSYGSFSLAEVFTDKLISWCPIYYHLKFAFLVWLQLPSTSGAKQIYANHLRPFLLRHQARVDQVLGFAYCEVIKLVSSYQAEIQFVRSMVVKITGSADQMLRGGAESDRSPQHISAEDPASDAESDQNHNH
ncbi:HVA22-like protein k [Glycine soja]